MTKILLNAYHCTATNIGDRMCGPAQYFWPKLVQPTPIKKSVPEDTDAVILGGDKYSRNWILFRKGALQNGTHQNRSLGGGGLPVHGAKNDTVLRVAQRFHAFSTRNYDWREEIHFVPCASCLSGLFDAPKSPTHDLAIYNHRKKPRIVEVPEGISVMSNSIEDPKIAIDFIASGDTTVTSSCLGVYWAQLLRRRVACIPYSPKLLTFRKAPSIASRHNLITSLRSAKRFPSMLEEYRTINQQFANRVEQFLND